MLCIKFSALTFLVSTHSYCAFGFSILWHRFLDRFLRYMHSARIACNHFVHQAIKCVRCVFGGGGRKNTHTTNTGANYIVFLSSSFRSLMLHAHNYYWAPIHVSHRICVYEMKRCWEPIESSTLKQSIYARNENAQENAHQNTCVMLVSNLCLFILVDVSFFLLLLLLRFFSRQFAPSYFQSCHFSCLSQFTFVKIYVRSPNCRERLLAVVILLQTTHNAAAAEMMVFFVWNRIHTS